MDTGNIDLNPPATSQGQRNLKTRVGKILLICNQIAKNQLDPKNFILGFLTLHDSYFYEMLVQNGPNHYECADRTV